MYCSNATKSDTLLIMVYVDDIWITGSDSSAVDTLISHLNSQFCLKDLGSLAYFLGIEAHTSGTGLHLFQSRYIQDSSYSG